MATYEYPKFKIRIAPESRKRQGLQTGDVVRRQYTDGENTRYSLMVVTATGTDAVAGREGAELASPYFVGTLLEGDPPWDGELLDFVRLTSLSTPDRSGALYLTAGDAEAPYLDVIDGMAADRALCHPERLGPGGYACMGADVLAATYTPEQEGVARICTLRRTAAAYSGPFGLRQELPDLAHPQRIVISFRARASKSLTGVPLVVGYADGSEADGSTTFDAGTSWSYHLFAITIDLPPMRARTLTLELTEQLTREDDVLSIGELNVVLQSDLSDFSAASKARVGRITGIADPLFGVLDGYGAYFQNLYATHNVNVAGTLTAGDGEGFASTFYVGRIHRNVLRNSLGCDFSAPAEVLNERPPTGVGNIRRLSRGEHRFVCQGDTWTAVHAGARYCFSFWCRSAAPTALTLTLGSVSLGFVQATTSWQRRHVSFTVEHMAGQGLEILLTAAGMVDVASPQLEAGDRPTLYQPTDEVLRETDEYGAWFSRGGIGGTIQHPLLKLEEDGTICSANGSFVINADGTGHFAGGRFRWTGDTIDLRGITIRWEDFDEKAQEALLPKLVAISGPDTFHYADALDPQAQPSSITLVATEQNFTAEARRWDYLSTEGVWKDAGGRTTSFLLTPDFHAWEGREVLTLRYSATGPDTDHSATYTVSKQYDGESAYSVYIRADRGTVLQNGAGETTLWAQVMRGAEEVTERIAEEQFLWTRQSDDPNGDADWNAEEHHGRTLTIDGDDVARRAVFDCEVSLN